MKRASHVGCNACNARIQRVLHRICYSNVAHRFIMRIAYYEARFTSICYSNVAHMMKRASSVQHQVDVVQMRNCFLIWL
jgi:hypothetical protein